MAKNIEISIAKKIDVQDSPFKIIIYVLKDSNKILIEDVISGRSVLLNSYEIKNYINIKHNVVEWTRIFNHQYIRIDNDYVSQFMPLYFEKNKFATLSFRINKCMAPKIKTKEAQFPNQPNRVVSVIDNSINESEDNQKTYHRFYGNMREFEVENFKLEMTNLNHGYSTLFDENFEPVKFPYITCRLPMFQLYSILSPIIRHHYNDNNLEEYRYGYGYDNRKLFVKINDKFYRFPYGNSSTDDVICLGNENRRYYPKKQPESIENVFYAHLVTTEFNGDYIPHLKYDNDIVSTLDINWIREKVNNNDFSFSYIDALFYLSQCKSARDVNVNIFLLSPNIPTEILNFETINNEVEDVENQSAITEI